MKAVILAGGSGERFWPLSTKQTPKQFLRLFNDKSLIRMTYERLLGRFSPEDITVITSVEHVPITREELFEVPGDNIVGEPSRMNTAPACVLGALKCDGGEILLTVPADHIIRDEEAFWESFDKGVSALEKAGGLFTFGIEPTRPETGYGYIEVGEELEEGVFEVKRFREKPNLETAREFISRGGFLWNSGMFLWRSGEFLDEMMKHAPEVINPLRDIDLEDQKILEQAYSNVERISVDNALMERSGSVRVVPCDPDWSDVGSWESVRELAGYSTEGPRTAFIDSERILVRAPEGRKVAVVGLKDLIIVETDEGLLVLNEKRSQDVRRAARKLKG
jgi:mannose-1-phosphate guanylyltransferase